MPLSENVSTFKVRESFLQAIVGESALSAFHLCVKGGF